MKTKKKPRGGLVTRRLDNLIQVWDGEPGGDESQLFFSIDQSWIPAVIAALKSAQANQTKSNA